MAERTTAAQFHAADGVDDWRALYHVVSAHFRTGSLAEGVALAAAIGRLAGEADHVTIDLRPAGVTVSLTARDVRLARRRRPARDGRVRAHVVGAGRRRGQRGMCRHLAGAAYQP